MQIIAITRCFKRRDKTQICTRIQILALCHCFSLSSKFTRWENLILHLSLFLPVGWTDLMALHHLPDLFAHRLLCFSYSYAWQTKLAGSLVNFLARYKI